MDMTDTTLDIDGSFGEGGGQILRSSLTLSLLTGRPFRLRNIRAGRSKPGLQPQHLMSVRAAAKLSGARLRGDSVGSSVLDFEPGPVAPGHYRFDIGTAGSTALVLQTLALPLALRASQPSEVTVVGGTHVSTSPCFHFLDRTWRSYLERMGMFVSLKMLRPGFYPRGGGVVEMHVAPTTGLRGLTLGSRGEVSATGFSAVAGLPEGIARRQARRARYGLERMGIDVELDEESWEGGPGSVVGLTVTTEAVPTFFFALGARGKPAETVADEAVKAVQDFLSVENAAVDSHSADQIILPLALAQGPSEYTVNEVTQHLLTNITVIQMFLDRTITCEVAEGMPGRVRVS